METKKLVDKGWPGMNTLYFDTNTYIDSAGKGIHGIPNASLRQLLPINMPPYQRSASLSA